MRRRDRIGTADDLFSLDLTQAVHRALKAEPPEDRDGDRHASVEARLIALTLQELCEMADEAERRGLE